MTWELLPLRTPTHPSPTTHTTPQRCFQSLEAHWRMQSLREAPARREIWRQKVQAVADESYALAQGLHRWKLSDQQRAAELEQRVELLGTSGRPDVASQTEEAMRRGFQNSKRVLEEAYATGTSILSGMGSQRETLKVGRCACEWGSREAVTG